MDDLALQEATEKSKVIGAKTMKMYRRGISRCLVWLYQHNRNILSDDFLGALPEEDLKENAIGILSLTIAGARRFLTQAQPKVPPINFALHQAEDFEKFLCSLANKDGGKPGQSVYDSMRSSLFHLYRGCGCSMSVDFAANLTRA
ncbi:unnamed protein product [Phytophthora lilii]|uniref:Unnamed protein product n=1 Tax=Phytophthora lilii TaxID=2077276 RepID=A0A9W6X6K5_9STRA|nr:unnamed protein product [Phytophthora lilii]